MLSVQAKKFIKDHETEALELLKTIAQIPSPSNHEELRMEFCRKWLEDMGAEGVYTDEALNVVYPYEVKEHGPVIVFMAHTDVVFPDVTPLPLREADGRLYCPGIGDDTANLVNILMTAAYVTQRGIKPKDAGILFVCNSGEEGLGNLKGSRKICQDYKGRIQAFYSFDGTLKGLISRAVGSCRFRVTAKTQGGHSYWEFGKENAIEKLSRLIQAIYEIQPPAEGKTTYNVGMISGGTSVNTIAQEASMLCEFRSDSKEGMEYMARQFQEIFQQEGITAEIVGERPCESLAPEAQARRLAMLQDVRERVAAATGREPAEQPGSTDCNIPLSQGIPAVCFGTYNGSGAHTREEYIEMDSLVPGREAAFDVVLSFFSQDSK